MEHLRKLILGNISNQIGQITLAGSLGFLAPAMIYIVFRQNNAIYRTNPCLFIATAGVMTTVCGLLIARLLAGKLLQGMHPYLWLGASLIIGYSGLAWQHLNSGYYIWLGIPLMFMMQAFITSFCLRTSFWRGFLAFAIMTIVFLGGHYVSSHREDFGVTNEYYFTYLIFLYPQLSIFIALVGRGNHG
jgi:hypothetical protein